MKLQKLRYETSELFSNIAILSTTMLSIAIKIRFIYRISSTAMLRDVKMTDYSYAERRIFTVILSVVASPLCSRPYSQVLD